MHNLEKSIDKQFEWYRLDMDRIFYGNDTERKLSKTEPGVLEKLDKLDNLERLVELLEQIAKSNNSL